MQTKNIGDNGDAASQDSEFRVAGGERDTTSAVMKMAKRIAAAVLLVSGFSMFAGTLADTFLTTRADTGQIQINAAVSTGSLSLTIDNSGPCDSFDTTNKTLTLTTMAGSVTTGCLTVSASTTSSAGYTLTIDGPDDGNLRLANQFLTPARGSMGDPATFATASRGGNWGFAIPAEQLKGFNWQFDSLTTYIDSDTGFNNPTNTFDTALFAAVPTEAVPFSQTQIQTVGTDVYNVFFGVSTGGDIATGTYSGMVTISGFGNAAAMPDCANLVAGFHTGCTDQNISVVLPNGLVPVRYTGVPGAPEWTVSGPSDPLWFDYANKEWANAVTFQTSANRSLPVGTVLNTTQLNDILGYWVYIPRFEYRIINTGFDGASHCSGTNTDFCPRAFDVRFVNQNVAVLTGTTVDSWRTHPGFQIDMNGDGVVSGANEQVAGFWMAKYAASLNKGDNTNCIAAAAANCNVTLDPNLARASTFVPGASTWTNIDLSNIFRNSQNIPQMHGITFADTNNFIVNGLTNASWGAVAYLSQSLYGVCTNRFCSVSGTQLTAADGLDMQKIFNNGYYEATNGTVTAPLAPRYITGCGPNGTATAPTDVIYNTANCAGREWHTAIGMLASSTHNASGIFDLAGGVWEYTFSARANLADTTTFSNWRSSGLGTQDNPTPTVAGFNFNRFSDMMYFNVDFTNCTACTDWQPIKFGSFAGLTRYFGLALAETVAQNTNPATTVGGWGGDNSHSPTATYPWFVRGGQSNNAAAAGVFAFSWGTGGTHTIIGWRPLLAGS